MGWLYFNYLVLLAWIRGWLSLWLRCPSFGYDVSCGVSWEETKVMFYRYGWEPWCFQKVADLGVLRKWRVP